MSAGFPPTPADDQQRHPRGFTLVELLVVMAIIVGLLAMVVPVFTQTNSARTLTAAAYNIAGLLENARAYAKANNTYTWVGFYEENTKGVPSSSGGYGRIVVSAVASKDATVIYPGADPIKPQLTATNLTQLGKLTKIENAHLAVLNSDEIPSRGKTVDASGNQTNVSPGYQVGTEDFAARPSAPNFTFNYPTVGTKSYNFVKIIQFNPLGDATRAADSPTPLIEIGLRPARGETVEVAGKNCAAIQVDGIGGLVRIYQP